MSSNGFAFIQFCNERLANTNEHNIALNIIKNIEKISEQTLESIAFEANISTASVSRFISKIGFDSFQDFKRKMESFNSSLIFYRHIGHTQRFMASTLETMGDSLFEDAIKNLQQTRASLDYAKLKEIVGVLTSGKNVVIVGDSHELRDFYTLQLDLICNGISTFLVNFHEVDANYVSHFHENDVLIFISVFSGWMSERQSSILNKAKSQKMKIVIFAQESEKFTDLGDIVYQYGIPNSVNDGYYSLPYLNRLISEMIYYQK